MEIQWLVALLVVAGVGAWIFATRQVRALGSGFGRAGSTGRREASFARELPPAGAVVTSFSGAPRPEARPSKLLALIRLLLLVMIVAGLTAGSIWMAGTLLTRALAGYVE